MVAWGVPSAGVARAESVVLLNTGHGKGKSSAAFGVMARGWARGWRVGVVQFIKGGKWKTGERKLADHLGIEWHTLGDGFTWESTDLDETAAKGRHAFEVARDVPFYDATITEDMVAHASRFAREMGVLEGEVRYGELVATQFGPLWRG